MRVLVDTNVLLRVAQHRSDHSEAARVAIGRLASSGHDLCIVPQVVYEFWSVATRPAAVSGLGLSVPDAVIRVADARRTCRLLADGPTLFDDWQSLVIAHEAKGKSAHDSRLVAAMSIHHVSNILTFNGTDFQRYPGIVVLSPLAIAQAQP